MNCNQANKIPLSKVLGSMNCAPLKKHSGGDEQWYENPLREERTPSFSVNHQKNAWHDLGTGEGGNVIDLVTRYTSRNVSGALDWLDSNIGHLPQIKTTSVVITPKNNTVPRFKILKVQRLLHPLLLDYVEQRGIDKVTAHNYLNEIRYLDTEKNKEFFGVGMKNVSGGFCIRNKYMKTNIAPLDIVKINPMDYSQNINVFEGFFDFLTYKTMRNDLDNKEQHIILNSTTMARKATHLIAKDINYPYQNVRLWFDNEKIGSKASESVTRASEHFCNLDCAVFSAQENYASYNDLNEYWRQTNVLFKPKFLRLSPPNQGTAPNI